MSLDRKKTILRYLRIKKIPKSKIKPHIKELGKGIYFKSDVDKIFNVK